MLECNVWRVIRTVLEMTHLWLWPILGMGSPLWYLWLSQLVTGSNIYIYICMHIYICIYIYQNPCSRRDIRISMDITAIYNWVSHMAVTYNILQYFCEMHIAKSGQMHSINVPGLLNFEEHVQFQTIYAGWWFQPLWKIWKSVGMINS